MAANEASSTDAHGLARNRMDAKERPTGPCPRYVRMPRHAVFAAWACVTLATATDSGGTHATLHPLARFRRGIAWRIRARVRRQLDQYANMPLKALGWCSSTASSCARGSRTYSRHHRRQVTAPALKLWAWFPLGRIWDGFTGRPLRTSEYTTKTTPSVTKTTPSVSTTR